MIYDKSIRVARQIGDKLLIEFAKELTRNGKVATGTLLDSLEHKLVFDNDQLFIELIFEDYGQYVDRGRRRGTRKVPIDALVEWIISRGIASFDAEVRSIAFAIQTEIFRRGIKRTGWFTDTLEKEEGNIIGLLVESVGQDIEILVQNAVNEHNSIIKPIEFEF